MALSLLICFGVVSPVIAQINRGTIKGTVSDPSGAVVAGASVTATNVATSVDSKATADANGGFTIPFLPPGVYQVTVEQPGFKKAVFEKVNVPINVVMAAAGNTVLPRASRGPSQYFRISNRKRKYQSGRGM